MKNYIKIGLASMIILLSGCTYDVVTPMEPEVPEVVSFETDIQPIFDARCNSIGCHSQNGIPPDLTAEVAWFNLVFFDYVDTLAPAESLLYTKIDIGGSMEQFATDQDRALILEWITQGAKDN